MDIWFTTGLLFGLALGIVIGRIISVIIDRNVGLNERFRR